MKLSAVLLMLVVQAVHDFIYGPRSCHLDPASPEGIRTRKISAWLGRLNALAGLVFVLAAERLARGL